MSLLLIGVPVWGAVAEDPIYGGLGVKFGLPVPQSAYGAELVEIPEADLPDNRSIEWPDMEPGATLPWRRFNAAKLPQPLRKFPSDNYVMLNESGGVMRVISRTRVKGCGAEFEWLKNTLSKKYAVRGDSEIEPIAPYARSLRIVFVAKQIDVRCGPVLVMDYMDTELIGSWVSGQDRRFARYMRGQSAINKRRMVLNRRKAVTFADMFTLGDQYRLEGAFGIQFQRPFAKNSSQKFPVDEPFYAVLPNLAEPFSKGEIQIVISPQKHPIVIRGTFRNLAFDEVAEALQAKYGAPMKASKRHIIHKVSGNHAIVKKMADDVIELAFIDTNAKSEQRQRLWDRESEGL